MSRAISNHTTKDSYRGLLEEIAWCLEVGGDTTRSGASDLAVSKWNVCEHLEHLMLADPPRRLDAQDPRQHEQLGPADGLSGG